jgi:type 1 glutamine amidotransferase
VFVTGDEEYRSEEGMTMLAKILSVRHGFRCTVLFAVHPETGEIDPEIVTNIAGLHHLESADLMVMFIRWRELPDNQMKYIMDYTNSGKPIIGLRTATHPFAYERDKTGKYARYHWQSTFPEGGYGQMVFGETWAYHHGDHGTESTRGVVNGLMQDHPILKGVRDIWGPTDVYGIRQLHENSDVLVYGQVLQGMEPDSPPNYDKSVMPIAWIRTYTGDTDQCARVFATTMGASVDLVSDDLRRLLVNASYWGVGLEHAIPEKADVSYVGDYQPTYFGFAKHKKGVRPSDLALDR